MAERVRWAYTDPRRWRLLPSVEEVLGTLAGMGCRHVILSNHVPELPHIVRSLGIANSFESLFNSAATGVEKPHPQAFQQVLDALPGGADVWMIGDSMTSDIAGAEAAGMRAILVHREEDSVRHCCRCLSQLPAMFEAASAGASVPRQLIRPAVEADVEKVSHLQGVLAAEGSLIGFAPTSANELRAFLTECFFVSEHDGRVIGFITAAVRNDDRASAIVPGGERYLEIEDLYVLPPHRSAGVGRRLVDAAVEWARQRGVRAVIAYTSSRKLDRIQRFYASCGFKGWAVSGV